MKQGESWFDPGRRKPSPPDLGYQQNMIARIFFPNNKNDLDARDRQVLAAIAGYTRLQLWLGEYVALSLVGHTDHRGKASYNKWLGEQRVQSVAKHLNLLLSNGNGVDFVSGVSMGEEGAWSRALRDMADHDRRVDVWWGQPTEHGLPQMNPYRFGKGGTRMPLRHF